VLSVATEALARALSFWWHLYQSCSRLGWIHQKWTFGK